MAEPAGTAATYIDAGGRARSTVVLLSVTVAMMAAMFATEVWQHVTLSQIRDGRRLDQEYVNAVDLVTAVVGLCNVALYIATAVVFLMWVYRAAGNLRALGVQGLKFTPGWAVGWWFVPIANIVQPARVMKELWQASRPDAGGDDWYDEKVPGLVLGWWLLFLLSGVIANISARMVTGTSSVDQLIASVRVGFASDLFTVVSAVLAIRMVRTIAGRQRQKALVQSF